jgi:exopolysaccharide biosynthesis protein
MFDGDVDIGLNLNEFANLFIKYGAVNAINLNGGKSTTVYKDGIIYIK